MVLGPGETDTLRVLVPGQGNRAIRERDPVAVERHHRCPGRTHGHRERERAREGRGRGDRVRPGAANRGAGPPRAEHAGRDSPARGRRDPAAGAGTPAGHRGRRGRRLDARFPRRGCIWEVGDTAIVGYDTRRGELLGRALGATTLTARLHGFDPVVWNVQVIPGMLTLDRRRIGIGLGERDSLRALLLDEDGKPLGPAAELEWTAASRPASCRCRAEA